MLAYPDIHNALVASWRNADHWMVGQYVVMPDHVHLFVGPHKSNDLLGWVRYWKRLCNQALAEPIEWQSRCHDVQIRTGEHYQRQAHYMFENPVRAGLVERGGLWPFQGEVNVLHWRGPSH